MAVPKFKKALWLEDATEQMEQGILTQADIDNALETWVDEMDGKTAEEIGDQASESIQKWFA